mmetsp:Transcript_85734/g.243145  ORF Transcript_85734/g.243145 Transcript_85734/m.243145 type:complete len:249 (-) Transcript_85734:79-825(-)
MFTNMFVLFALLAPLASGMNIMPPTQKVPFRVIFDTTCSDCQQWVGTQFKPLWEDEKFRLALTNNFDFNIVAYSVTRHKQGDELNKVLNCGNKYLRKEAFLPSLFCWESSVEAWVPNKDGSGFHEAEVDINAVVAKCFATGLLQQEMVDLQTCRFSAKETTDLANYVRTQIPAGFNEVPWVTLGTSEFAMAGNDKAIYHLKEYLCETWPSDACTAKAAAAFLAARKQPVPAVAVPEATASKEPWSCKL